MFEIIFIFIQICFSIAHFNIHMPDLLGFSVLCTDSPSSLPMHRIQQPGQWHYNSNPVVPLVVRFVFGPEPNKIMASSQCYSPKKASFVKIVHQPALF